MPVQHEEVIKVLANCASTMANDTVAKGKDGSFPDQGAIVVCGRFGAAISVYPKATLFPFVAAFCGSRRASRRSRLQNSTGRGDFLNEHTLIGQAQLVLSGGHSVVQVAKRGGRARPHGGKRTLRGPQETVPRILVSPSSRS